MNWVSIGSGNGLSPVRRQAITWTRADLLSIGPLGTYFNEMRIEILFIKEIAFENVVYEIATIFAMGDELIECATHVIQLGPLVLPDYRKTSSRSRTKFQNLNVSCIPMQLSSLNSLKPGVKLIMKMLLEQRRQAMLQLHLSYQQFYCLLRCDLY